MTNIQAPQPDKNVRTIVWLFFLATLCISVYQSLHQLPFIIDDSLISYRYSDRLLHGHGLTWNDGEFVEGYSTLLWVLLVAAGGLLQPDLMWVGWALGLLANAASLVAVVWAFRSPRSDSVLPTAVVLITMSLSENFAIWGVAGMETALFDGLLAWAIALSYRTPTGKFGFLYPACILSLLSITRPDGILLGAGIAIALMVRDGVRPPVVRRTVAVLAIACALLLLQILFRLFYYGSMVPNTAYAKLAFSWHREWDGVMYLVHGALVNGVPLAVITVAIILLWRRNQLHSLRESTVFFIPGIVWLSYVGVIGGDNMLFSRHWMPAFICFAFGLGAVLSKLELAMRQSLAVYVLVVAMLFLGTQAVVRAQSRDSSARTYEKIVWDGVTIGRFLEDAFGRERPLLAVNSAGCLPYASKLPALDMLGLTDANIAHHRPRDMGKGYIGHELGDGAYVLSRKPDLVMFCVPPGYAQPCFRSEQEMATSPEFQRNYRLIFYRPDGLDAAIWTRIEGGRLGIVRRPDAIVIPGYLFATGSGTRAILDVTGKPVAELDGGVAFLNDIYIPPGTWEFTLVSNSPGNLRFTGASSGSGDSVNSYYLLLKSEGVMLSLRISGKGLLYAASAQKVGEGVSF